LFYVTGIWIESFNMAFKEEELELREEVEGQTRVLDVEAEESCVYLVWTGLWFSITPLLFIL